MRTITSPALLALLLASACAATHGGAAAGPAAPPVAPQTIVDASHAFFAAYDAGDVDAAGTMLSTDFLRVASARRWSRDQTLAQLKARHERGVVGHDRAWDTEQVRVFPGMAVFNAETTATVDGAKADGKPLKSDLVVTLVWVSEGGKWHIAHWQSDDAGIDAERQRWNDTFRDATGFNVNPNKFLMESVHGRKPGKALDVASGQGRNSIFLASQGWDVTGVDISDEGLRITQETAAKAGLTVHTVNSDIDQYDWGTDQWDLICFIYAGGREHVANVKKSLKKGGIVVVEFFHEDAVKGSGIDAFKTNELPTLYKDGFKVLHYEEIEDVADYGMRKVKLVRFVAEKL